MKKILFLSCFLLIVAACAAPPTNRESIAVNTSSAPAAAPLTEADAITKEKAIWDSLKAKNYDAFGTMMAADYLEVLPDGVNDRAETLANVKDLEITDVTFADWRLVPIDKDAAVLLYTATIKGKFKGQAFPEGPYRVSSGWVNRDGKWQAFYYQETMVEKTPPPSPSPAASTAATPASSAASPAASPTALPTDATEREKVVWDALKRRDYNAFASFLDEAQVEVEPSGVYDKAGTLRMVQMFDASRGELTDFRTMRITPNSELVNYVVSTPGPKPEKHFATTIWVNRGGKWAALFHQGTMVMSPGSSPSPTATGSPAASPTVTP